MSEIDQVWDVFSRLMRQFPFWPSTFNTCQKCGKHPARGSDICSTCLTEELGKLVGGELALDAYMVLNNVQRVWGEIAKKMESKE